MFKPKPQPIPELTIFFAAYSAKEIATRIETIQYLRIDYARAEPASLEGLLEDCDFLAQVKKVFQALAKQYHHGN